MGGTSALLMSRERDQGANKEEHVLGKKANLGGGPNGGRKTDRGGRQKRRNHLVGRTGRSTAKGGQFSSQERSLLGGRKGFVLELPPEGIDETRPRSSEKSIHPAGKEGRHS